jgi:hypothetical protein
MPISSHDSVKNKIILPSGGGTIPPFVERTGTVYNVKSKILCYDTGRKCEVCEKPVFKKYQEEINLQLKRLLSRIVVWDDRYTCGKDCRSRRFQHQNDYGCISEGERANVRDIEKSY